MKSFPRLDDDGGDDDDDYGGCVCACGILTCSVRMEISYSSFGGIKCTWILLVLFFQTLFLPILHRLYSRNILGAKLDAYKLICLSTHSSILSVFQSTHPFFHRLYILTDPLIHSSIHQPIQPRDQFFLPTPVHLPIEINIYSSPHSFIITTTTLSNLYSPLTPFPSGSTPTHPVHVPGLFPHPPSFPTL